MRPVRDIDPEFFAPDEELTQHVPLLDAWVARQSCARPLADMAALQALGLDPARTWWLDIPYTSHQRVRASNLLVSRFAVLEPYAPRQHARVIDALLTITRQAPGPLLVLDDGAYVLEALASLAPQRRPRGVTIVEQTTRGFIKLNRSANLRHAAGAVSLIDVARSSCKRKLEPPFIGMAVCAALQPHRRRHFGESFAGRCLVLGYAAIGEQVATFLRHHFAMSHDRVFVHDPSAAPAAVARARGFPAWDRDDFATCFDVVVGCSGQASL